ncbi:hypothetical protein GOP47_0013831 [Adiantum capillus-veneris]|uniref:Uncharacterized protein n=1 Tax=Adiantum capillus-veneris TaxID=13818 RepID=A0A9D4UP98_ADICA|nr:hypothetical protein GOP47_0013831 [Adiantum capillus-veneris]
MDCSSQPAARNSSLRSSIFPYWLSVRGLSHVCFSTRKHRRRRDSIRIGVFCRSMRRHLRRRETGFESRPKDFFRNVGNSGEKSRDLGSDDDSVVLTLDFQHVKQRAEAFADSARRSIHASAVRAVRLGKVMMNDGCMFLDDLRSSVSIQKDRRVVISLRRSSIDFALTALLWTALLITAWKLLTTAAKKYHWGWEESFGPRSVIKRDRSLGGREVFVGKSGISDQRARKEKQNLESTRRKLNPLDMVEISRSERDIMKSKESKSSRKIDSKLPYWWPSAVSPLRTSSHVRDDATQEKASSLLKMIIEKRTTGKDFEADDILQLYRMCKYSGSSGSFDSAYVRDSFYRAAVNMALSSCGRSGNLGMDLGGEKAPDFLAGLASSIHLDAERAAIMVNAAIAARTRSTFLQAWALCVQGKVVEAEEELVRLSCILNALPPGANSPEMEMVAQGLGKHLSFDERSRLLEVYVKGGGSSTERVAAEALGLRSTGKRP